MYLCTVLLRIIDEDDKAPYALLQSHTKKSHTRQLRMPECRAAGFSAASGADGERGCGGVRGVGWAGGSPSTPAAPSWPRSAAGAAGTSSGRP